MCDVYTSYTPQWSATLVIMWFVCLGCSWLLWHVGVEKRVICCQVYHAPYQMIKSSSV